MSLVWLVHLLHTGITSHNLLLKASVAKYSYLWMILGDQKTIDERIGEVAERFLKKGLLCRTERKYKKPKPGKPRLVKWPKTLEPVTPEV